MSVETSSVLVPAAPAGLQWGDSTLLVLAEELEAMARRLRGKAAEGRGQAPDEVRAAVLVEREACALVAESFGLRPEDDAPYMARAIMNAIRARE